MFLFQSELGYHHRKAQKIKKHKKFLIVVLPYYLHKALNSANSKNNFDSA